jgi:putative NADPH-quinone reductase
MNRPIEDPLREHFQQKIAWADRLVFFFPLWWMDAPAILKNFLDMNLTS